MNTSSPLGVAIIGTGAVAEHHAAAVRQIEGARLLAVCSSTVERAWEAAGRFGVRAYADFHRMLTKEKDVEAVILCTASGKHLEPTLACAGSGRHVISEKPLEVSLPRARQMISACRQGGVKLACIFQNRYSEDFRRMKAALDGGRLGRPVLGNAYIKWYRAPDYYASSSWRGTLRGDGGAAFINQGIHTIDLLQHLLGPVARVYAQTRTLVHHIEGEDVGVATLEFESGALGTVEASTAAFPGRPEQLAVYGEKGRVVLEGGAIAEWKVPSEDGAVAGPSGGKASGASDPMAIGHALHARQLEQVFAALRAEEEPEVNGEEGLKALTLVRAMYHSAKKGEPVDLAKADFA